MSMKKNSLSSGNKAKKSKNDFIRSTLGVFLKQKNYAASDKFRKTDLFLQQTKRQFLFNKMIENDISKRNSFTFSNVLCITNNYKIVDQQFSKFIQFIESQTEPIKSELQKFIAPLLCHLYLELLKGHETKAATELLKKNAHLVAPVEHYEAPMSTKLNGCSISDTSVQDESILPMMSLSTQIRFAVRNEDSTDVEQDYFINLIQVLSTCSKIEVAEGCDDVITFRSAKYEIHISDNSMQLLSAFLQKQGHVLILRLIYNWLHVNIKDIQDKEWSERALFFGVGDDGNSDDEDGNYSDSDGNDQASEENNEEIEPAADIKQEQEDVIEQTISNPSEATNEPKPPVKKSRQKYILQVCMKGMRLSHEELQKFPENPRFIHVLDPNRTLVTADLDPNECHLAAGFSNSEVKLWQLNNMNCAGRNFYSKFNDCTCPWEINNVGTEYEDFDRDEKYGICDRKIYSKFCENKYEGNSLSEYGGIYLRGHSLGVTDIRFSTHFPILLTVSKDKTMRCWRSESYTCASIYRGHNYPIWCVAESPVKMFVATGSRDLTARLWSLDREFPLITYIGHIQDVGCITFHPNGNYIATGSSDLSLRLWCVTSGKLVRVFSDCKLPITSIAFSPDGKLLAAGGEETKIRIFDLAAGSQLTELKDLTSVVTSLSWSSSGKILASAASDGTFRVWDVAKLGASSNENGNSSTSTSSCVNRIKSIETRCPRIVKVHINRRDTITNIGSQSCDL